MTFSPCPLTRTRSNWRCWPSILRRRFVDLKSGDWVVQNAANSSVGRWVIAFAKARGLKTVNIVHPEIAAQFGLIDCSGCCTYEVDKRANPDLAHCIVSDTRQLAG